MIKFPRKFVLFITAAAFLFSAVGLPLLVHLVEHRSDAHHDHKNCPICQQVVVGQKTIITPYVSFNFELPSITIANVCAVEIFVKNSKFITPPLRAPPSAA